MGYLFDPNWRWYLDWELQYPYSLFSCRWDFIHLHENFIHFFLGLKNEKEGVMCLIDWCWGIPCSHKWGHVLCHLENANDVNVCMCVVVFCFFNFVMYHKMWSYIRWQLSEIWLLKNENKNIREFVFLSFSFFQFCDVTEVLIIYHNIEFT